MANVFPIVAIELQGTVHQLTLVGAVMTLLQSEMFAVALMVFVPTLFLPGLYLLTLLFVLWLTGRGDVPASVQNRLVRMMQQVYPWSMVEVFLLGVLVAIIKLSSMASIIAGPALWAWMGTTITLTVVLTFRLRRLIRRTHMPVGEVRLQDDQVGYAGQPPARFFALQKGGHRLRRREETNGVGNDHHIVIFGWNLRRQNRGGF